MFNCAACKAKDDEIKHLRALVDSILMGKGLAPVVTPGSGQEPSESEAPKESISSDDNLMTQHGGDV